MHQNHASLIAIVNQSVATPVFVPLCLQPLIVRLVVGASCQPVDGRKKFLTGAGFNTRVAGVDVPVGDDTNVVTVE